MLYSWRQFVKASVHVMIAAMHLYEVRPRKDKRGVDLISDALPFGRLWYGRCEQPLLNLAVSPTTTVEQ
jgi:hypothetical protein